MPLRDAPPDVYGRTKYSWDGIVFFDETGEQALHADVEGHWPMVNFDNVSVTISFEDANGNRWNRSSSGGLVRLRFENQNSLLWHSEPSLASRDQIWTCSARTSHVADDDEAD